MVLSYRVSKAGSLPIAWSPIGGSTCIHSRVWLKQRIRFPLFERLFRRISVLRGASRREGGGGMLYVSGALQRTYTLFYPHPTF
jgi:hypothetical protein